MNKQLVVIMAHPDDAEILCFGTILKYLKKGYTVDIITVCSGENGISLADRQHKDIRKLHSSIRHQESLRAFEGTSAILKNLEYEDGNIQLNGKLISDIELNLHQLNPQVLITHYVEPSGLDHQDHRIVGQACVNASLRCKSLKILLQAEPLCSRINFFPNYFINISNEFDRKIEALKCHESQKGRDYLTKEYHLLRGRQNANKVTYQSEKEMLFESFYSLVIDD
jgi:LmbE family N-acetylglucosaminyl deacetylase